MKTTQASNTQQRREYLERCSRALRACLAKTRKEAGLSQEEACERGGMERKAFGRIERGDVDPRFSTLLLAARALGLSPETFLRRLANYMKEPGASNGTATVEKYYATDGVHWIEIRRGPLPETPQERGQACPRQGSKVI